MNNWIILDIISYTDVDTKLVMNNVNKQYRTNVKKPKRFSDICKMNSIRIMNEYWKVHSKPHDISNKRKLFMEVCMYCDIRIVKIFIKNGLDIFNAGLEGACASGNIDTINLMIEKGADDWDSGLISACKNGKLDIVKLMIKKGAKRLHEALFSVFYPTSIRNTENLKIVKILVDRGASYRFVDLLQVCWGGHLEMLKLLPNIENYNLNICLSRACIDGHIETAKYLIEKGANDYNRAFCSACESGNKDLIFFLIEKGANAWNNGLFGACRGRHDEIVKLMVEKGATNCEWCNKTIDEHLKN
jgi:ankyrin repeat protein